MDHARLREKLEWTIQYKNGVLEKLYDLDPLDPAAVWMNIPAMPSGCGPMSSTVLCMSTKAIQQRKNVLFEGAQGTSARP
jgi:adenylosuccinate synthase